MKLTEEQKELCKEVRELTGVGIFNCREALKAVDWNVEDAVQYLKDNPRMYRGEI